MNTLMINVFKTPVRFLLLVLIITVLLLTGINNVFIDSSTQSLLRHNDPDVAHLNEIKEIFGDAVIHTIVIKSDTIFKDSILQAVVDITDRARDVEGVDRVVSMATVINLKDRQGDLFTGILLRNTPPTPEALAVLKQETLSSSMFINDIIDRTGTATGIHLFLDNDTGDPDFDTRFLKDIDLITASVRQALPGDVEIYHIGTPKLRSDMISAMNHDAVTLVPLAGLIVSLVLYLFFRTWTAVWIPLLTGSLSIAATIGFMGLMGYAINPVSVIIPTLLYVVGSTEDIHLLSEYLSSIEGGAAKKAAVMEMIKKCNGAITLTALTTFLGFITLIPNSFPILRQFGIAAAFGIAINFIFTIIIVPVVFRICKPPVKKFKTPLVKVIRKAVIASILNHRFIVAVLLVFLVVLSIWGINKIYIETDYIKFFKTDAHVPRMMDKLNRDLTGGTNFMVVVESDTLDAFLDAGNLKPLTELLDYLDKKYGKAVGYSDFIRTLHREINGGNQSFYTIPEQANAIAQYNLLINRDNFAKFMNPDYNQTCILVKSRISGTREIMAAYQDIKQFAKKLLPPGLRFHITGEMILVAKASNEMTHEILRCLLIMFLAIFVVCSTLFLSIKAGALAMIPNMMPVLVLFGFMGLFKIPLSVATFPIAVIALGIAVDDTIHFMARYAGELKKQGTNKESIISALGMEIRPVFVTSLALIAGFLVLGLFGRFGSTVQFGQLAALCLAIALVSDLLITPIIFIHIPIISPVDLLETYIRRKLTYHDCKLLEGLKKNDIRKILTMGEKKNIPKGTKLITQGDKSTDMLLIIDGKVDVINETSEEILATLGTGDIVGEMSFLTDEPRSAGVVTCCETEILEIDKKLIHLVARRFPKIGTTLFFNISQILSDRLKQSNIRSTPKPPG